MFSVYFFLIRHMICNLYVYLCVLFEIFNPDFVYVLIWKMVIWRFLCTFTPTQFMNMLLTDFVLQPREMAIRLRVQVALEDAEAHAGLIVCLVGILLGVLVPGLSGNSVVVFEPAHYAIVIFRMHNGVWLLCAKGIPKLSICKSRSMRKCLYKARKQSMSHVIHSLDLMLNQGSGSVHHVPIQVLQ